MKQVLQPAFVAVQRWKAFHDGVAIAPPGKKIWQIAKEAGYRGDRKHQGQFQVTLGSGETAGQQYSFSFKKAADGNCKISELLYQLGNIHLHVLSENRSVN